MLFTDYLDSVANTEDEARFFEELAKLTADFKEVTQVPVVGKLFAAIVALSDCESIDEFKESGHYQDIEGWDISINLDTGLFAIYPGAAMRKKALGFLAFVCVGIFLLWLWRRCCRKNKE